MILCTGDVNDTVKSYCGIFNITVVPSLSLQDSSVVAQFAETDPIETIPDFNSSNKMSPGLIPGFKIGPLLSTSLLAPCAKTNVLTLPILGFVGIVTQLSLGASTFLHFQHNQHEHATFHPHSQSFKHTLLLCGLNRQACQVIQNYVHRSLTVLGNLLSSIEEWNEILLVPGLGHSEITLYHAFHHLSLYFLKKKTLPEQLSHVFVMDNSLAHNVSQAWLGQAFHVLAQSMQVISKQIYENK